MIHPPSTPPTADAQGRVVLEACEVAELGAFLAGIAGWVADGHNGWQNMSLHVGMALDLPGPDDLGDLDAIFETLDRWVERLNPPEAVVRTTDRRWR